ncbi:PaeR7I family type II restriction endonuclease [Aquitalea sp. USM4]|uniref:PaeR7I family type II restriction endonuclease n=1 Tax=Aquitalea sp. USM4 TaxID=1590041 RepID=UPI00103D8B78|nr:PaeR7I family type II restriction endonuclease [Aquitalea sp. USM4]QBJ77880.1 restriction endonuclease [Aquitalea sp. USM4]
MALDLANYQEHAKEAIMVFWGNREAALRNQVESGHVDAGTRGAVTAGKNLDGFIALMRNLVVANGLHHANVHVNKGLVVLPGFFRPTKQWDLLVVNGHRLVAAIEFKSQVGSFGNNYNNRTEEAIGTAHCLWTAYRDGALGNEPRPFLGWLMVVEDAPGSQAPVRNEEPHFPVFPEFRGASYLRRYDLLCQKLVREQLYSAAALLATPQSAVNTGSYTELSTLSGLGNFVTAFAGHIAAEAARTSPST